MDRILEMLGRIDGLTAAGAVLAFAAAALVLLIGWRLARGPVRLVVLALGCLLLARAVLFANPAAWFAYFRLLDPATVDARGVTIMANRARAALHHPGELRYLAVGSSQTFELYREQARARSDLDYFYLPGMTPVDMLQNLGAIADRAPRTVLLFVSEFDLSMPVAWEAIRLGPVDLRHFQRFAQTLLATEPERATGWIVELLALELAPEQKYDFVFRSMLRMGARPLGFDLRPERPAPEALRARQIRNLEDRHRVPIERQAAFLDGFLDGLSGASIAAVIVEGQYHPAGFGPANRAFRETVVRPYLERLGRRPGVRFVSVEETGWIPAEDWADPYHVRRPAGLAFTTRLLEQLEHGRRRDTIAEALPAR